MSHFADIAEDAINTVYDVFAEEVQIESATAIGVKTVPGIYSLPHEGAEFGGVVVDAPSPTLELRDADVADTGVAEGDTVHVRGVEMRVISLSRSDDGNVLLELREYR